MLCVIGKGMISAAECADAAKMKDLRDSFGLRRSDRYTAIALAAANRAVNDAKTDGKFPFHAENTGVITSGNFGPHATVCRFLDDLLDFPEYQMIPTKFSHSVHNAAGSYIAARFGFRGPGLTLTGFSDVFYESLKTAEMYLSCGMCKAFLLVAVEEKGTQLDAISKNVTALPPEGAYAFVLAEQTDTLRHTPVTQDLLETLHGGIADLPAAALFDVCR